MDLSNELSYEAGSFSCLAICPQIFTARGFEDLSPLAGTLGCSVCLTPQLFLPVYAHANVGPPSPLATALLTWVLQLLPCQDGPLHPGCPSLPLLPVWMNVFNSLVVGLPYSSIFWQFWLFFVLNSLSFFWLCEQV